MKKVIKIIIGVLLILSSVLLIGYSEYKVIKILMNRDNLNNEINEVKSTIVDKNNNDKLIFMNGYLILNKDLEDKEFNVSVRTSKLERVVEIYQYKETKEEDETYSYETDWYSEIIDSSEFKNDGFDNPSSMKYENSEFASKNGFNVSDEYYTTSKDIDFPEVGDIRISFRYNSSSSVSVIAKQNNDTLSEYKLNDLLIKKIYNGKLSKDEVIKDIYPLSLVLNILVIVASIILSIVGFKILNIKIIYSFILSLFIITVMFFKYNLIITILGLVICSILVVACKKILKKEV